MSSSWWTLIRSRLPEPVGGLILPGPERYTGKSTSAAVRGSKMYDFRCVRAINLLEGYGNDNPGSNAHVR